MTIARIDFETRSTVNLRTSGADKYAAHEDTGIWCLAWAIDDDPVRVWYPGDKDPALLLDHIESGGRVSAFNAPFELAIWRHVIPRICPDWPALTVEQTECTMAAGLALSLPGAMDKMAQAVGLPFQKDMIGHRLMLKMCVPTLAWRKARDAGEPLGLPEWHDSKEDLARLGAYCANDVVVERALAKRIAPLTASERKIWLLDRKINNRGVRVDVPKVEAALAICEKEKGRLTRELKKITKAAGQEVTTANSQPQMLAWLASRGVQLPDLKKRKLGRFLRSDTQIPDDVRRVLQIRLEIAKASTAKLKAMLAGRDEDDRCRGLFAYHKATTGRFGGRRIQLHNFPRPDLSQKEIDQCLDLLEQSFGADIIRISYADPIPAISSCLRGLIVPEKGKKFVGGDFSAIENRVLMWLADEEWMLKAFRDFDRGEGVDNYKLAYSRAFNIPVEEVTKAQRLIGKVSVLANGYAGAVGAWLSMSDNYEVMPGDVARAVREVTPTDKWMITADSYPKEEKWRFGLDVDTWTGIRIVVDAWRQAHPNTVQMWWDLQDAAINATQFPRNVQKVGKIQFVSNKHFLFCKLPSGRCLAYARPEVSEDKEFGRECVFYYGQGKISKRWEKRKLTPQILSENVTSGCARDALTDAMHRVEAANYPISIHVHDEIVSEVPLTFGSPEEFEALMCDSAPWLAGCPIAAEAWWGSKYQK